MDRRTKLKSRSLERGSSAPLLSLSSKMDQSERRDLCCNAAAKMGHEFKRKTYYKPTYCQHCTEMLWGLKNQGYQCTVCSFISHERCLLLLVVDCTHMLAEKIINPIAHTWMGPKTSKRKKWCNICRRRINGPAKFCKICRLYSHAFCVHDAPNNCKNCASYKNVANTTFIHHWIEGNLSTNSKCEMCGKSCYSDFLSGFHCGWCGITLHSICFGQYAADPKHEKCNFRDLAFMVLPPSSVSIPVKETVALEEDETVDVDDVPKLFVLPEDEEEGPGAQQSKNRPVIVIDSSGMSKRLRKRTLHPTQVDNKMTAEELLSVSLRKCSIPLSPTNFYLSEVVGSNNEREILSKEIVYNLSQSYLGPLKLYLRKRELVDKTYILKVFNSKLSSVHSYVTLSIDEHTSVVDIIKQALVMFELEGEAVEGYCLYEMSQIQGVNEREMLMDEKPWKRILEMEKDSLKDLTSLRYYLHIKETTPTTFYLWKVDSVHLQNAQTVCDFIKNVISTKFDCDFSSMKVGPLFPKLGACFVNIECTTAAKLLYTALSTASNDSCKLQILPNIHEQSLNPSQEPVLVFINGRSGGNQGYELINGFCRHLNPYQVYDLSSGGPLPGLYAFRNLSHYRILVGGGDGTVGWVLSGLDIMRGHLKLDSPPCAVLPLGTGNDLARALKWGGGYSGEKVMNLLYSIEDANCKDFDRWKVDFKSLKDPGVIDVSDEDTKSIVMNNYLGIGIDAEIALDFHQAREENPEKFNSRFHNKGVYLQLGVQKTFSRDFSAELHTNLVLKIDGNFIPIPTGLKGIVILNIESWGAGSEPWGNHVEEGFFKNSFDDGILEVMGLCGPVHLGQIKGGMKNGVRIAQGSKIAITLTQTNYVQIDGEAWIQEPSMIEINELPYKTKMLSKSTHSFYQRGLSHHVARTLIAKNVTDSNLTGLSSRRQNVTGIPDIKRGSSTHTMYHKIEECD